MVPAAHACEALVSVCHQDSRRVEVFARPDSIAELSVIDAHHETALVILVEFRFRNEAARVHQGKTVA